MLSWFQGWSSADFLNWLLILSEEESETTSSHQVVPGLLVLFLYGNPLHFCQPHQTALPRFVNKRQSPDVVSEVYSFICKTTELESYIQLKKPQDVSSWLWWPVWSLLWATRFSDETVSRRFIKTLMNTTRDDPVRRYKIHSTLLNYFE